MRYAKLKDNKIYKYPLTFMDIRREFPFVSFPEKPLATDIEPYGYVEVYEFAKPEDTDSHKFVEVDPTIINGKWTQTYKLVEQTNEEQESQLNEKIQDIRDNRNRLLFESDWTQLNDSPVDKTKWAIYRQELRDITKQENFPNNVIWPNKPN